jgi:UDP-N-acetylglucosamine 2-epimerase (non-hydrolysing)
MNHREQPVAIVVGTRPEIIKCSPVIAELSRRDIPFVIIHSGQHYTAALDAAFFDDLDLPAPTFRLQVGSLPPAIQLARIIERATEAFLESKPRWALVQGDTNTVLGAALAALKLSIPVAHLEAGLRSFDWDMPEEANRVLAGRLASLHLCPTELQAHRLAEEGIREGVHVVGNTIVDAVAAHASRARTRSTLHSRLDLQTPYAVLTLHRPSNVDDPAHLFEVLRAISRVAEERALRVFWPVHPRSAAVLAKLPESARSHISIIEPLGYLDFLRLLVDARLVLTDSGGLQEEACTLRIPCITLRTTTERPETVEVGANILCSPHELHELVRCVERMWNAPRDWKNPFGDGHAAERVVDLLMAADTRRAPSAHRAPRGEP